MADKYDFKINFVSCFIARHLLNMPDASFIKGIKYAFLMHLHNALHHYKSIYGNSDILDSSVAKVYKTTYQCAR